MRRIWRTLRGRVRTAPSFGWYRVLRPTSDGRPSRLERPRPARARPAAQRRGGRGRARPPDPRASAARPARGAGPGSRRAADGRRPARADVVAPRRWRLHPDYDEAYLTRCSPSSTRSSRSAARSCAGWCAGATGACSGWFVAFVPAGGIAQVQQLAAVGPDPGPVLDHLIAEADARGAAAVAGRLEPSLADAVRRRRCVVRSAPGRWPTPTTPACSRRSTPTTSLLTRLDGEWWMGHHLLYRGGNTHDPDRTTSTRRARSPRTCRRPTTSTPWPPPRAGARRPAARGCSSTPTTASPTRGWSSQAAIAATAAARPARRRPAGVHAPVHRGVDGVLAGVPARPRRCT